MVTRKLNSDGRVNTMQTLHNLNEDELSGFEEAWKGNARKHLSGWNEGLNMHDGFTRQNGALSSRSAYALPSTERPRHTKSMRSDTCERQALLLHTIQDGQKQILEIVQASFEEDQDQVVLLTFIKLRGIKGAHLFPIPSCSFAHKVINLFLFLTSRGVCPVTVQLSALCVSRSENH
ncbi:uncharacterized protein LOC130752736 isoform X4 [Actinidia eriantha]|uniref:uncharacterized protein LOC130752736 isoform X4 n=1 Tax=Actinidia eriantha TaxID=165200 RepID=UPI00258CDEC4|nr:uncharacterized protein LOC130752736 isoform X4 [Actinidia eriantha]